MLPSVKTILYASDLEDGAKPAFRSAVSLCGHYQSKIVFLHVIEPLSSNAINLLKNIVNHDEFDEMTDQGTKVLKQKVADRLDRFFESELNTTDDIAKDRVSCRIEEGVVWEQISKVAEEIDADLIVMGLRKKHKIGFLTVGSTAHQVIEHANKPVMIVPL